MLRITQSSSAWSGDLGKQLGDPLPALAVLFECPGRAQQLGAGEPADRRRLAGVGRQLAA